MHLPATVLWQLPLASAMAGYGIGYFLPSLALERYYPALEQAVLGKINEQLTRIVPGQVLQHWLKRQTPKTFETWLSKRLGQLQQGLQSPATLRKLYRLGDDYIPNIFEGIAKRYLYGLDPSTRDKITVWAGERYEQLFSQINLQYHQAEVMMDVIFGMFLTPAAIRQMLLDSMEHLPAETIERMVKQELSGFTGILAKFVDLKPAIERFKNTVADDPKQFSLTVTQLLDQLEIREKLAERLSRFRWNDLPESDRENIKRWLNRFLDEWLQDDPDTLCQFTTSLGSGSSRLVMRGILQTDWHHFLTIPADASGPAQKTVLGTLAQNAYDTLSQAIQKPPEWLFKIKASVHQCLYYLLNQYPLEKRQTLALASLQSFRNKMALYSAGLGASYGILNVLILFGI